MVSVGGKPFVIMSIHATPAVRLTHPVEDTSTERHQWKSRHKPYPGPFATRDSEATRGHNVRDVSRYQHPAADEQSHQHTALLSGRKRGADLGGGQRRVVDDCGYGIEPE